MFKIYAEKVEQHLIKSLPSKQGLYDNLINSMEYSLLAGGKRIRPVLLLEFCRVCCGEYEKAIPFASAIEMVHTYSLIHDDLPCMDDDELRRGKPSNHIKFGEAIALLSGDALLNLAFETMFSEEALNLVDAEIAAKAVKILADASGSKGMIAGQVIDLESEGKDIPLEILKEMDLKKTGALIVAAAKMGCILAKASEKEINAAEKYSKNLGLAFQVVDDILDVTSSSEVLGKKVGSDEINSKSTYVSILGLEKSKEIALNLTEKAIDALNELSGDTARLKELAFSLINRKK